MLVQNSLLSNFNNKLLTVLNLLQNLIYQLKKKLNSLQKQDMRNFVLISNFS